MRRTTSILAAALLAAIPATAQNYKNSRYYNPRTGHLDYSQNRPDRPGRDHGKDAYFGLRIGPAFSHVSSDDSRLDGGEWQTGLNVGVVAGFPLTYQYPLYLETGLSYIEKGGKKDQATGEKMTYSLNYLEIPLVLKYKYNVDNHFSIQPQVGGYFAVGVGGKTKNYQALEAQSSFNRNLFQRCDGGLRFGCGIGYDMFYFDVTYDLGLANIGHDTFKNTKNGSLQLNFGVNF